MAQFLDRTSVLDIFDDGFAVTSEIDSEWAKGLNVTPTLESYFDYYFSGQDCMVFIEGYDRPLPIMQFAYTIEQKKTPVYGHASHTYDAVMRGNRLVTGGFTIVTKYVNYMTDVLISAANVREELRNSANGLKPIKQDLEDIQRYWHINTDNALSPSGSKNIFSSHPPFNMYLNIGIQPDSVTWNDGIALNSDVVGSEIPLGTTIANNWNQRLVDSNPEGSNKRLIQNVELVKMDMEVAANGEVIAETYSFFARDEFPINN